ncbi:MAG: hypothetical protein IGS03_16525 [Candidatus Sericytochromatia bacterium]|nr:hypothetical protein [Candidatus Sericytochromatia bacterium]
MTSIGLPLSEGNEARIYLNEALIATVTPEQQPQSLELGPNGPYPLLTSQRNELRFEVHSSSDSGYSYDFELSCGEGSVFKDRQGDAEQQQKVRTQEGSPDTRTGLVYQERLWLHNTAILPVGAGDYWVKVYNLGADEEVLLQASNQIGDIQ